MHPTRPAALPVVLVTSCNRLLGDFPFHVAGRKYVEAVRLAGALPLVAPPVAADEVDTLLDAADGVLLTGSPSNVHPAHFGQDVHDPRLPLDPERDAWTLPLARRALARGVPLLGICRGAQEVNVALGGSLHQAVHELPGHDEHRGAGGDDAASPEALFAPAHEVSVVPGSRLGAITGLGRFRVNSVHGQGVARLADGLRAEAHAPDGLVEAFTMPAAPGFNLCVQWHPEWRPAEQAVSMALLRAFGDAVRQYRDRVRGPLPSRPLGEPAPAP